MTHLMSPIVNKGEKLYDSSSFAFSVPRGVFSKGEKFLGVSGVRFGFLLVIGGAECALIWLSVAYCEGMHFGLSGFVNLSFCLLLYRLCRAFASFWRNRCFASA